MRSADRLRISGVAMLLTVSSAVAAEPEYNKVETFEPGKKYSCVPSEDRKSWNCTQQAGSQSSASQTPPPAPVESSAVAAAEPAPAAAVPAEPARVAAEAASSTLPDANPSTEKPSQLPSYLKVQSAPPTARNESVAKPVVPAPEQPTRTAEPATVVESPAASAPDSAPAATNDETTPAQLVAEPPTQAIASPSEPVPSAPPAEAKQAVAPADSAAAPASPVPNRAANPSPSVEAAAPVVASAERISPAAQAPTGSNQEFLKLSPAQYVIELGHSAQRQDNADLRDTLKLAHGQLYELRLNRDGGDWWLLVWASFESIEAARSARSELPADSSIGNAWPRPIAALQKEIRRAASQ